VNIHNSTAFAREDLQALLLLNPLNAEVNPICHLLALVGAHPILHISRIRVKLHHLHTKMLFGTLPLKKGCF